MTEEEIAAAEAAKKAEEEKAAAEAAKKAEEEKAAAEAKKAEEEKAAAQSPMIKRVGAFVSAGFGMFNVQFDDDHFKDIPFAFGVSGLIGKGQIAGRVQVGMEYHQLHVDEGANSVINEGYWRLGLGLFAHYMPKQLANASFELGVNFGIPTSDDIVIPMYAGTFATTVYAPKTSINVELGAGYSMNLGSMPLDLRAFVNYDVTRSMEFQRDVDGNAWHIGARATIWALDL